MTGHWRVCDESTGQWRVWHKLTDQWRGAREAQGLTSLTTHLRHATPSAGATRHRFSVTRSAAAAFPATSAPQGQPGWNVARPVIEICSRPPWHPITWRAISARDPQQGLDLRPSIVRLNAIS
jgi:hypothetical protein